MAVVRELPPVFFLLLLLFLFLLHVWQVHYEVAYSQKNKGVDHSQLNIRAHASILHATTDFGAVAMCAT